MAASSEPGTNWSFVLHGGCTDICPDASRLSLMKLSLDNVANKIGIALSQGVSAKDTVILAISALEDRSISVSSHGIALKNGGVHQPKAGIANGRTSSNGTTARIETIENNTSAANAIPQNNSHTASSSIAADSLAKNLASMSMNNEDLTSAFYRAHWERLNKQTRWDEIAAQMGPVGVIILDSQGKLAVGASTGGPKSHTNGRIGDANIPAISMHADARLGVVVCNSPGSAGYKRLVAADVTKFHTTGNSLTDSAQQALQSVSNSRAPCAVAAIDSSGNIAIESTARVCVIARGSAGDISLMLSVVSTTIPILPPHEIYSDEDVAVGLSRYPTTTGQTLVKLKQRSGLFSLPIDEFVSTLTKTSEVASIVSNFYEVERSALVTTDDGTLSILPLHGLCKKRSSFTRNPKKFNKGPSGHISSRNGPMIDGTTLDVVCAAVRATSGIEQPFNCHFDGPANDATLFASIIRGETQQWRVWEDDQFVAFLSPIAKIPGSTVLVPRKHLSSDILSMKEEAFVQLMKAAHAVGNILKQAFKTTQCGMIFEGPEIGYAHVKLIPIHQEDRSDHKLNIDSLNIQATDFYQTYQGFVSSASGPLVEDFEYLAETASNIRKYFPVKYVHAPKSWTSPEGHLLSVLSDPWYENLFSLQDVLFHTSVEIFRKDLDYRYCFMPLTIDAVSSPMSIGSDSRPAQIPFLEQQTHLMDSVQLRLEHLLRIKDQVPGVYHINTSFCGEDPDAMHLNQFYHVRCELRGSLLEGVSAAERYIMTLVSVLVQDHVDLVKAATEGSIKHLTHLIEHYHRHGDKFPSISMDDALNLPGLDNTCWQYLLPNDTSRGRGMTRKGELRLIEHFGGAVWLTEMDHLGGPFYQAFVDDTHARARCADLLLGNGECLSVGERHISKQDVLTALDKHEVPADNYAWYTEIRTHKPVLTTGWGMGTERFLAWVLQHNDVRDMTLIPRMKGYSFAP